MSESERGLVGASWEAVCIIYLCHSVLCERGVFSVRPTPDFCEKRVRAGAFCGVFCACREKKFDFFCSGAQRVAV